MRPSPPCAPRLSAPDGPFTLLVLVTLLLIPPVSDVSAAESPVAPLANPEWKKLWYSGKAEVNRYSLDQARYGEVRSGDAVLIFVTEDFLPETQVKFEGRPAPDRPVSVFKLNAARKFNTGVYPYSTMTSVFTPVAARAPGAYKVTTSVQEWCGHVFMQLNRRGNGYRGAYLSYFQSEGDAAFQLPDVLLEDEIWTRLRLNPGSLPVGEIEAVPGTLFLRLMHREARAYPAIATYEDVKNAALSPNPLRVYRIEFPDLRRSLAITFETDFPYAILAWEETSPPLGGRGEPEVTRAVRTHSLMLDYWNLNRLDDDRYRAELGLD
jgi:hypothetical protein